jgi:hypothetical protein
MELVGGLLVLIAIAYLSLSVCATGLCSRSTSGTKATQREK